MSLRIGVTWDADGASAWHTACVDQLVAVPGIELALLIEARREGGDAGEALSWLPGRKTRTPRQRVAPPGAQLLSEYQRIAGRIDVAGTGCLVLTAEQVDRVRQADLDCIVHLAGAGPAAALCAAARFGVWSIHHGDGVNYSPGPITDWEPHCRGPVLHVALIATLGDGSPSMALQEGRLRIASTPWPTALEPVLQCAAQWPAKVIREALDFGESALARARPAQLARAQRRSGQRALGRGLYRFRVECHRLLIRWLGTWREDQWAIGIVDAPIHAFVDAPVARPTAWVPEYSRDEYLADPFALRSYEGVVIHCERFDHRTRRGEICAVESPDGRRFGRPRTVLALPAHLSYPFPFEHEGALYCIPEMGQSGGIQLFELVSATGTWCFVATLIEGVAGIDPTILRYGDCLWLFCTTRDNPNAALQIWWAPALTGPWRPHRRNPVKFDVRSTRPAGSPFEHGGQVFRPSQDCSETYGGAIHINRIVRLTVDDYEEESVAVVRPDAKGPYPAGLHTLSALGDWTLIDGKRRRWRSPWQPRGIAAPQAEALRQALGRLRPAGAGRGDGGA